MSSCTCSTALSAASCSTTGGHGSTGSSAGTRRPLRHEVVPALGRPIDRWARRSRPLSSLTPLAISVSRRPPTRPTADPARGSEIDERSPNADMRTAAHGWTTRRGREERKQWHSPPRFDLLESSRSAQFVRLQHDLQVVLIAREHPRHGYPPSASRTRYRAQIKGAARVARVEDVVGIRQPLLIASFASLGRR